MTFVLLSTRSLGRLLTACSRENAHEKKQALADELQHIGQSLGRLASPSQMMNEYSWYPYRVNAHAIPY